ncbi:hypothetical protein COT82_02255 [Candidatus Campbellbacteria bacterium CG10_big_fil_rev_8_21_14_0_10_35_52]|uniref:Uncharacterized protein n=1 Tax=Candidatus Campbellbacteria bacterium CG10_big_fil_rev_8_21_14_0_10_35_52 TaxID=1974527 RepID=A0A2M6WUZ4_9BACT|nr:MAG: hypothetical protein COT82_02255 [Candidatus Campbellbacteria bacterium CG10_big_fil_rev_8_21_14_0_10_35_52]
MKILLSTITILLFSAPRVFAHEEGTEITNVAESDWVSPLIAIIVIVGAIIVARAIRARSSANKQIMNNK